MNSILKPFNIFIMLVFLLIGVEIIKDLTSPRKTVSRKTHDIKYVRMAMSEIGYAQGNYRERFHKFAETFDELKIDSLKGGNTTSSKGFQFKIIMISKDYLFISAKSIDKKAPGFSGAVILYKLPKGSWMTKSTVCESETVGMDGTAPAAAPIFDAAGKGKCPTGWNGQKY